MHGHLCNKLTANCRQMMSTASDGRSLEKWRVVHRPSLLKTRAEQKCKRSTCRIHKRLVSVRYRSSGHRLRGEFSRFHVFTLVFTFSCAVLFFKKGRKKNESGGNPPRVQRLRHSACVKRGRKYAVEVKTGASAKPSACTCGKRIAAASAAQTELVQSWCKECCVSRRRG